MSGGGGSRLVVLMWSGGVVGDGEEMALGDGDVGVELAGVDLVVGPVVVGDAEVFGGGDAEGEGASGPGVVLAGGDGGEDFGPFGGGGWCGHWLSADDWMRGMFAAARAALVEVMELVRLTARVASSMTMVWKPRACPSMAE